MSRCTWIAICIANIRFYAAIKAQHVDRASIPFTFPLQRLSTYFTLGYFCIVVFFNGCDSISGGWDLAGLLNLTYQSLSYLDSFFLEDCQANTLETAYSIMMLKSLFLLIIWRASSFLIWHLSSQ